MRGPVRLRSDHYGLRDAVAEVEPAAFTEVVPFECCASTAPKPFTDVVPPPVAALAVPAPVRLAAEVGFCTAADTAGEAVTVGLSLGCGA
jgi:hypothetical protein